MDRSAVRREVRLTRATRSGAKLAGVKPKLTQAEKDAQTRETEAYLREHFGFDPTPEERAKLVEPLDLTHSETFTTDVTKPVLLRLLVTPVSARHRGRPAPWRWPR